MSEENLEKWFPRLRDSGYRITSDDDVAYNCAAYAVRDQDRWWEPFRPDGFWPDGVPRDDTVEGFVALYQTFGFEECEDGTLSPGFEKIAIYGVRGAFSHVARQLPSGDWTSKLGELEDIEHRTLEGLVNTEYGRPVRFMRRQSPG